MVHLAATLLVALSAQQCTPRAIGPGTHVEGGMRGAACVLTAYRRDCRPADYTLTGIGIGTIAVKSFSVERWNGRCAVLVISTVTTGGAHGHAVVVGPRVCRRVRKIGDDVVVDRCSSGAPKTFSLTSFA
jgi:hypothetical protein